MMLNGLPNDPAIITTQGTLTYSDLEAHIALCTEHFSRCGLIPGHKAALIMPQSPRLIVLLLALIRYGAIACPIPSRLPKDGIEEALETLGANAVFHTERANGRGPGAMTPLQYDLMHPEDLDDPMNDEDEYPSTPIDPQTPSLAVFTSGSSGTPKAAVLNNANIIASASAMNEVIPLTPDDRWLLSLPLYHIGGLSILFRCFQAGAAVILPKENKPLLSTLQSTECTHLSLVSTQLYRLMQNEEGIQALQKLKAVMLGGGAVSKPLIRQAIQANINLYTSYGMTETTAAITCTRTNPDMEDLLTSGFPIQPNIITISKDNQISVSGSTLFQGYLVQGKFEPVTTENGWFTTSDLGHLDNAGRLHITGRSDNMMISGGENIQPEEIEAALCNLPGVIRAIVIPETDTEFAHRPIAFVETEDALNPQDLETALRKQLPGFKIPKRIEPWPPNAPEGGIKASRAWFKALVD